MRGKKLVFKDSIRTFNPVPTIPLDHWCMDQNQQLGNRKGGQVRSHPLHHRELLHWSFQHHDHSGVGEERRDSAKLVYSCKAFLLDILWVDKHGDPAIFVVEARYNKGQEHDDRLVANAKLRWFEYPLLFRKNIIGKSFRAIPSTTHKILLELNTSKHLYIP